MLFAPYRTGTAADNHASASLCQVVQPLEDKLSQVIKITTSGFLPCTQEQVVLTQPNQSRSPTAASVQT